MYKIQPPISSTNISSVSASSNVNLDPAFEKKFKEALEYQGFKAALENDFLQEVFRQVATKEGKEFYEKYFAAAESGKPRSYFLEEFKKTEKPDTLSAFQLTLQTLFKEKFDVQAGKEKDKEKLEVQKASRPFLSHLSDAQIDLRPTFHQSARRLWNPQTPQITHIMIGYSPSENVDKSIGVFEDNNLSPHYFIGRHGDVLRPTVLEDYKAWFAGLSQYGPYQSKNGKYDNDDNVPNISMNNHAIGIWLSLKEDEPLTKEQRELTVKLCQDIAEYHKLPRDCILPHGAARERSGAFAEYAAVIRDSALWRKLSKEGLGYWVEDSNLPEKVGKDFDSIQVLQALRKLGLKIDEKDEKYSPERAYEVFNKQYTGRNKDTLDDYALRMLVALVQQKEKDDLVKGTALIKSADVLV